MTLIVFNSLNKRRYLQKQHYSYKAFQKTMQALVRLAYKVELDVMASGWFHIIQMSYKYFQNYIILSYM